MSKLNWARFKELSGAESENFEKLCRAVIKSHFATSGTWHELKNQPGVEFFIALTSDHQRLGSIGKKIGWQCKWFEYRSNGCLTSNAKKQIRRSLNKTKEHVPDLDYWALWTHEVLSKPDLEWFLSLQKDYSFELQTWNQEDLNELLSGPAIALRSSYFGELALTTGMLEHQHQLSIAPVKERWMQQTHQITVVEKKIRKVLGEQEFWKEFEDLKDNLSYCVSLIEEFLENPDYEAYKELVFNFIKDCRNVIEDCTIFDKNLTANKIEQLALSRELFPRDTRLIFYKLLARLRAKNLPLSLIVTNALNYIEEIIKRFAEAEILLSQQLITVVANAGNGKTQLSIEVSASKESRPAGIYILGRQLRKGMTLDDLAKRITFYGENVKSFESLLVAINSVAERAGCRLPIVIDGLNESEEIRLWKDILEPLAILLKNYPNVVVVCTSRNPNDVLNSVLPESTYKINLEGFEQQLTKQAVKDYFSCYKIKSDIDSVPLDFFNHPLTLKIFCEVTNRDAKEEIEISSFPSSMFSLFSAQIEHIARVIEANLNLDYKYTADEVNKFLYHLGEFLYDQTARFVDENDLLEKNKLPAVAWHSNIINLLVQEGIILRECSEDFEYKIFPVYDRMGGYLIAKFLLGKNSQKGSFEWLSSQYLIDGLFGSDDVAHPLAEDILFSLTALMPEHSGNEHLYNFLPDEYKGAALRLTPSIEKRYLHQNIIEDYKNYLINGNFEKFDLVQILRFKLMPSHPLNILFLNDIFTELSMPDRDVLWTELIRKESDLIVDFLREKINKIKENEEPESSANLFLIYISWFLTSTTICLRDTATELIFNLGLKIPNCLFDLTIEKLEVNDPYIYERLLAASYAVASIYADDSSKKDYVIDYSKRLYRHVFSDKGNNHITHILSRDYASSTIKVVLHHNSDLASIFDKQCIQHPFPSQSKSTWGRLEKNNFEQINSSPLRMDFENYTIGRLAKGRANYDYTNKDYIEARENILWRIEELGWSQEQFKEIDNDIERNRNHYNHLNRPVTERYGKKYSWIAYYELAGMLCDQSKLCNYGENRFAVDIDPFFPIFKKELLESLCCLNLDENICKKHLFSLDKEPDLSYILELKHQEQKWILLYGIISENNESLDRQLYCTVDTCFASKNTAKEIVYSAEAEKVIFWPSIYESYSTYIGEYYCEIINTQTDTSNIVIDIDYEEKTIKTPHLTFFSATGEQDTRLIDKKVNVPIQKSFKILPTICKYAFENNTNSISKYLLTPWVVKHLGLKFSPIDGSYLDKSGSKGTLRVKFNKGNIQNHSDLLYLRYDLFCNLLKSEEVPLRHIRGSVSAMAGVEHSVDETNFSEFDSIFLIEV